MKPYEIIKLCSVYLIKYFGTEHKHLIEDRLDQTDFYLVNQSNHDDCVKEHIFNNYKYYGLKCNDSKGKSDLIETVEKIASPDTPNGGYCVLWTCTDLTTGKIFEVSRGMFVFDYTDNSYKSKLYGSYSDTIIFHEFCHAVTLFVKNNETYSGFEGCVNIDIFNEYFIETMAIDLSKMMHRDGKTFNEKIPLTHKVYYISRYGYLKKSMFMLKSYWEKDMKYLKDAIITGEHDKKVHDLANKLIKRHYKRK